MCVCVCLPAGCCCCVEQHGSLSCALQVNSVGRIGLRTGRGESFIPNSPADDTEWVKETDTRELMPEQYCREKDRQKERESERERERERESGQERDCD